MSKAYATTDFKRQLFIYNNIVRNKVCAYVLVVFNCLIPVS